MRVFIVAALFNFVLVAYAVPPFDPAGAKNVGNGHGTQFITGQCLSDADCGSACCAGPTGICSGPGAQFQAGKTGCGFSSTGGNPPVASPSASPAATANGGPPFDPAGVKNVGNGAGQQFIGGQCLSGADCASACCAGPSGICSGPGAQLQAGKTGCGFSSTGGKAVTPPPAAAVPDPSSSNAASTSPAHGGPLFDPAGAKNVGNGAGGQFITGQCLSDADCGSGCCAGPSGICSGPGAQLQAGKTGCGFPSANKASPGTTAPAASNSNPASTSSAHGGPPFDPAGIKNIGNGEAKQFIGGQCLSGADCASACCAGPSGICSGPGAQRQAGKTGCGFTSGLKLVRF